MFSYLGQPMHNSMFNGIVTESKNVLKSIPKYVALQKKEITSILEEYFPYSFSMNNRCHTKIR